MRKKLKFLLFFILVLMITQFTFIASFAAESAGMREETSALENIYQDKAKTTLNTLLNPDDYTIVVSASIRNDEQKIKEYHDQIAARLLPGLNMNDPLGTVDTNNILSDLKQKVDIQVILTDNAPADRDNLVKEVLKSKLKLNEESGDSITVSRATRSIASLDPAQNADKLPELSGKMIIFWIVLALLTLVGVGLWLYRKQMKAYEEEEKERAKILEVMDSNDLDGHGSDHEDEEEEPVAIKTPEEIERERDALEMKLAFAKGELVKIVKDYPSIVCRAAEEFVAKGFLNKTTMFLEALGWDNARKLFTDLDGRLWTRIGASLREREADPTLEETYDAVHVFHRYALSFVLERSGGDSENPFSFIFQLTDSQRIDLLSKEAAYNIALISIYCSGPQMSELLSDLSSEKQNQVLLEMTQVKQLPESVIKESVEGLLMQLERIKSDPSVHADGPTLAADFMRNLSPAREEELYQQLLQEHPAEAEKLRRVRVMFQDIPYYPAEAVRKVIETFESEEIMRALVGYEGEFVESFLSLLPTKKALMIQNDLYHMTDAPPISQCAECRRKISIKLEQDFEMQRFGISEYWKQFDEVPAVAADQNETTESIDAPSVFEDDDAA